ncbi:hypothetical protein GE061_002137, partial [Apolygus lucorum]
KGARKELKSYYQQLVFTINQKYIKILISRSKIFEKNAIILLQTQ